jgi:hypothetical protein
MKTLGTTLVACLMATAASAGGPVVIEGEPVVIAPAPGQTTIVAGGLSGTGLAAGLGALLLLGILVGGGSGSSTTTTTTASD